MADTTSTWSRATSAQLARRPQGQETSDSLGIPATYRYSQDLASLRHAASRFSLNEQFAATRREYEFGYDDVSSIWEKATVRSRPLDEIDATSILNFNSEEIADPESDVTSPPLGGSDFYDILCVSRDSSAENIRRAYLRLVFLLDPDKQPPSLRQVAEDYFVMIQTIFERLINPYQRARYDLNSYDNDLASIDASGAQRDRGWTDQMMRHLAVIDGESRIWDLGASFNVQQAVKKEKHNLRQGMGLELVDFGMNHAVSVDMTDLDWKIRRMMWQLRQRVPGNNKTMDNYKSRPTIGRLHGTVITLQASVYGLLQDRMPVTISFDRGQLSFPRTANRDQFTLLRYGLLRPSIGINLRHVLPRRYNSHAAPGIMPASTLEICPSQEETVVEIEFLVLPTPITTVKLSKPFVLPFDGNENFVTIEMQQGLLERRFPRLATTLERPTAGGWLLLHLDSGHWRDQPEETCRHFDDFTRITRSLSSIGMLNDGSLGLSTYMPPRAEIAFTNSRTLESQESRIVTRCRDQGICALDVALENDEEGAWTIAASAEPRYCSVSAKYARDVDLSALRLGQAQSSWPKTRKSSTAKDSKPTRGRFRVEAEIGTGSLNAIYLAFRCLKRVGRLSKVGFEMGFGRYSLYLSVYWSRLGQRINVPFYLGSRSGADLKTFLLLTLVPFASFALWELWEKRRRRQRHQQRLDALEDQHYAQKRRTEADMLTALMTPAVQTKQKTESKENGLVILSAKYGVKARGVNAATAWGAAEVADVTIPVAALVDRGQLVIPSQVRKSHIPGFWDPEPAEEKVLHIRYSYQGREATVEVRGDEEQLVLPPPWV